MKLNKNIISILFIILVLVGLVTYMITVDGWANIVNVVKKIEPMWIVLGMLCMIIYWVIEAIILNIFTKKINGKAKFRDSLRVTMIGQLFNNLTPFASGGQPVQGVTMVKNGVSVSKSASILLIKFIVFQFTLVVYTSVVMIFQYAYFNELVNGFVVLSIVGFVINLFVIISLIVVGINENIAYNILRPIYRYLDKLGLMKNVEEKLTKLRQNTFKFHEEFKIIKKEKMMIFSTCILTVIQLTSFFLVAYTVYRGFGNSGFSIFKIISAQAFLMLIMAFIPTPGAGGAAEGGFYIIFSAFFHKAEIKMAILFWRLYTFYLPIVLGSLFLVIHKRKSKVDESIVIQDKEYIQIISKSEDAYIIDKQE